MFDSLITSKPRKVRGKKIPLHQHGIVFFVVLTVLSTSIVTTSLVLRLRSTADIGYASDKPMTVWFSGDTERDEFVAPLTLQSIAQLATTVEDPSIALFSFSFLLDGLFDPHEISGITFFVDGVQIGYPATPDENGQVWFAFEPLILTQGKHTFDLRITAPALATGSAFRVVLDPKEAFTLTNATGNTVESDVLYPFASNLHVILEYGQIGAFVRSDPAPHTGPLVSGTVHLYAEGEDMRLDSISLEADRDLTGSRIDVFSSDKKFITSAYFNETTALLRFDSPVQRLLRTKNTPYTLLLADFPEIVLQSPPHVTVVGVSAEGYQSQHVITLNSRLELF